MSSFDLRILSALTDNYIYLIREPKSGTTAVVDPSEAEPVITALEELGLGLDQILITHHHYDHVGGVDELKHRYRAHVTGPAADAHRIDGLDTVVSEGDLVTLGGAVGQVFETPGHTSGHISFYFADQAVLFCGDTLFAMGCGRLFEGTPGQMWHSLKKLSQLPGETLVCCAHEYTASNTEFALSIDRDNPKLRSRADRIFSLRAESRPTVPSRLEDETATNPFLRADDPAIRAALGKERASAEDVFAEIRRRKDSF